MVRIHGSGSVSKCYGSGNTFRRYCNVNCSNLELKITDTRPQQTLGKKGQWPEVHQCSVVDPHHVDADLLFDADPAQTVKKVQK